MLVVPHGHAEIRAAVAANFRDSFEILRERFTAQSGIEVAPSYGASGMLYTQIKSGAPFAVFFSADIERPALLEADGLALPGSRFVYAIGALVLWTPDSVNPTAAWLRDPANRIAIANPALAPYGVAAEQTLTQLGLLPDAAKRIVMGSSIAQAMHFIATRAVPGGLVARAQVVQIGVPESHLWQVPASMHTPIEQAAVAIKVSDAQAARDLLEFMRAPASRELITSHGYGVP